MVQTTRNNHLLLSQSVEFGITALSVKRRAHPQTHSNITLFFLNLLGFIQRIVGSDMAELLMRNSQGQYGSGGSEGSEAPTLIGRGHHTTRTEEDVLCLLDI